MKKITVLVVDDDIDDQEWFELFLNELYDNVQCERAFNGKEALALLDSDVNKPDIIFLDIHMPIKNGIQFLQEFNKREGFNKIPVVITSTTMTERDMKRVQDLGFTDFFDKPSDTKTWHDQVTRVMSRLLAELPEKMKS
ncbi:hypothetical protein BH09BAC3_BH09BAC3_19500 [soil metagenome]